jgi:tRNA (cmo5U34)-methyltransferase
MNRIKNHFESEAEEFDSIILKLIPYYSEMVEALALLIPFGRNDSIKVIDLGCGTGTISKSIIEKFPNARITCLDIAENMIGMARMKLNKYENISYSTGDFSSYEFNEKYDVIVSSLALHHLAADNDKKIFYTKIYNALNENGVFYNADVVLGSNDYNQDVYMKKWKEYMNKTVPAEEIDKKWIPKYYEEDRPARLISQLEWLKETGFRDIDIIWKYYDFAVYGGCR